MVDDWKYNSTAFGDMMMESLNSSLVNATRGQSEF
jgi:hypothetical protein